MPELPEVETVRRGLNRLVIGKTIQAINILWDKTVVDSHTEFKKRLIGRTIKRVDRRGKYLLFRLNDNLTLVSHLRMEGHYQLVQKVDEPFIKHTCVTFTFTDGTQLRYIDSRKFGRMNLIATDREDSFRGLAKLGPEPLSDNFDVPDFARALRRHHKPIKTTLLDQTAVAGLGNIYVDETLWMSYIHPLQPADTLTDAEIKLLHDNIITELKLAIAKGGTTFHSFIGADGKQGEFQNDLHVYNHAGEPCERCGTTIIKIKVNQRGTSFCPHCQVLHKDRIVR
ncbi:MAG: DNA-formamidopyrimidine glycosylase [Candidatus Paralactobacillus gallistercoris]|uniref:Formamidopyrimidine-DNA glycosylase n=1 Tax=Candidatus Paralactobacillus gallistercoris TaxID=2838724 RepID=A0A948WZN6_9LACO|nr:DNA-formamidopyrimidine glycosylase [Candidatus Paralactobacillus gallistercoris]